MNKRNIRLAGAAVALGVVMAAGCSSQNTGAPQSASTEHVREQIQNNGNIPPDQKSGAFSAMEQAQHLAASHVQ